MQCKLVEHAEAIEKEKQLNISNIEFRKKIENLVKAYNENDK